MVKQEEKLKKGNKMQVKKKKVMNIKYDKE